MKLWIWVVLVVLVMFMGPVGCQSLDAKGNLGEAQRNPSVDASYGWFSGAKLRVSSTAALTVNEFGYTKNDGFTAKGLAMNTDPVPAMDAQTRKIRDAFVPVAEVNVKWADQFGKNGALWIDAMSRGLTSALHEVSLPAQVVDGIEALLKTIETVKAQSTQPAAKSDDAAGAAK